MLADRMKTLALASAVLLFPLVLHAQATDPKWNAWLGCWELVVENATRGAISPDGRALAFLRDELRADTIGTAAVWVSTPSGAAPWWRSRSGA